MIEAMNNPQMRHAAVVHLPVVLAMVAALLALLSAVLLGKNTTLRWLTLGIFVLLIVTAKLAENSGEEAEGVLSGTFVAAAAVSEVIEEHESMAQKVFYMAIVGFVLIGASMVKKPKVRVTASWLTVVMAGVTAAWVGATAHHGGELVYLHGAGSPENSTYVATADPIAAGPATDDARTESESAADPDSDDAATDGDAENEADTPVSDPRLVHFREQVKPVLEEHCIKCHNPTRKRRSAELDQTSMASMLEGGWSGPAVIPGNPDESWLIIAVRHEQDMEMPPNKDKLSDEVIAALAQWIRDGAVWEPLGPPPAPAEAPAEAPTQAPDDAAGA
jgi:mono/diheme cytochrome c family protein